MSRNCQYSLPLLGFQISRNRPEQKSKYSPIDENKLTGSIMSNKHSIRELIKCWLPWLNRCTRLKASEHPNQSNKSLLLNVTHLAMFCQMNVVVRSISRTLWNSVMLEQIVILQTPDLKRENEGHQQDEKKWVCTCDQITSSIHPKPGLSSYYYYWGFCQAFRVDFSH